MLRDGLKRVRRYRIAFYEKNCRVILEESGREKEINIKI